MSVPEGMRSKSKLEAIIQARKLAAYTIQITSNAGKFPPKFQEILGKQYAELAIKIFNSCLMFVNPQTVKTERHRLRKMARLVNIGRMTHEKYEQCYQCWRSYAVKGSSHKLVERMDRFHLELIGR